MRKIIASLKAEGKNQLEAEGLKMMMMRERETPLSKGREPSSLKEVELTLIQRYLKKCGD